MATTNKRNDPNKDLLLKGSKWYLHMYLPASIRKPQEARYLVKNLQTDSIIRARQIRDDIKREMFAPKKPLVLTEYEQKVILECKQFARDNPHLEVEESEEFGGAYWMYKDLMIDSIIGDTSNPNICLEDLSENDQHKITVLGGRISSVCYLRDLLIDRKRKLGLTPSVPAKIKTAVSWLLGGKVDMDIGQVTWKMVDAIVSNDSKHSAGYIRGLLCYISELWQLARRLDIPVSSVNPALGHRLKSDKESYDVFVGDEVKTLYAACKDARLKLLIHAGYVSGMRLSEIVSARIIKEEGIPCWQIVTGKNDNAIRLIPVHSSIDVGKYQEGWAQVGERFLSTKFTKLVEKVLPEQNHRKLRVHSFRHTFVNYLSALGQSDYQISRLTGHGKVSSQGALGTYQQGSMNVKLLQPMIELIPDIR